MACGSAVERVLRNVNRIEDVLESQRRLGPDKDLAVASELLSLVNSAIRSLSDGNAECPAIRLDRSLALQPHVICIRSVVLEVLSNLLANATEAITQAAPPRGLINFSASRSEEHTSELQSLMPIS